MKRYYLLLLALSVALMMASCSDDDNDNVDPADEDVQLSSESLDFGTDQNEMELTVMPGNRITNWLISKPLRMKWLYFTGDSLREGRQTITIGIIRDMLPIGLTIDTLKIIGRIQDESFNSKEDGVNISKSEVVKSIVITIKKIAPYKEVVMETIGNGVEIVQTCADSSFALLGTFQVDKTTPLNTAYASFYANNTFFVDAGEEVTLKGKSGRFATETSMPKSGFQYQIDETHSINATYYMPDTKIILPTSIVFDDETYHIFNVDGGTVFTESFTDSIMSVSMPEWTNAVSSLSSGAGLTVDWNKTDPDDDSVFVVVYAKSDTNVKVSAARPVADDVETLTIESDKLARLFTSGASEAELWIIRYRFNRDETTRKFMVSQSQKLYTFTLN